ncbi:hypothetical protein HI914_01514 [Erysiphe necator]|nr:hypothetical protein HI914_01514 [Erysiphe necator]
MAVIEDFLNIASIYTQSFKLSSKNYYGNMIGNSRKGLEIYEEFYIHNEQHLSSCVKDTALEIMPICEVASRYLSYLFAGNIDFEFPFTLTSGSMQRFLDHVTLSSHQNQYGNETWFQQPWSHTFYPMRLTLFVVQSAPSFIANEGAMNDTCSREIGIEQTICNTYLKSSPIFPLLVEVHLPSLNIQTLNRIISPFNSLPLSPIDCSWIIFINEKPTRRKEMTSWSISDISLFNKLSMINLYSSIPLSSYFIYRRLQLTPFDRFYCTEGFHSAYQIQSQSFISTQPLIMYNSSVGEENSLSQKSFQVTYALHDSPEANFSAGGSSKNEIRVGSMSLSHISLKSHRDIRDPKDERQIIHDSLHGFSKNSKKFHDSHRTSYSTIDQIEMDLNANKIETSLQKLCRDSLKAYPFYEGIDYAPTKSEIISGENITSQINNKLKTNQNYGSPKLLKTLDNENLQQEAACSDIFSRIPHLKSISEAGFRSTGTSSKLESSKNQSLSNLLEKKILHGLNAHDTNLTPLGSVSLNQRKLIKDTKNNFFPEPNLNYRSDFQDCGDLRHDHFVHNPGSHKMNRTMSLSTPEYKNTKMFCLSYQYPSNLISQNNHSLQAPRSNSLTKQLKLRKCRPQLMKALPPIPSKEYNVIGKNSMAENKDFDHDRSPHSSPWHTGSETSSLKMDSGESFKLKFFQTLRPLTQTNHIKADNKTTQNFKKYDDNNYDNTRSPPKLRLKARKFQNSSPCPSISRILDSMPWNDNTKVTNIPDTNKILDLDKYTTIKSSGLRVKHSQNRNPSSQTVHIKRAPISSKAGINLPHSNSKDLFTIHKNSDDIIREPTHDLQLRKSILDSDNLITNLSVSNIKVNERKRIKRGFLTWQKRRVGPQDSTEYFRSKIGITNDEPKIKFNEEVRKSDEIHYRGIRMHSTLRRYPSKDGARGKISIHSEPKNLKTPRSTPNFHQKYFESVPCLREEPQGQILKVKIRDWIKSAKSAISNRIESHAKVWRKKHEILQ